MTRSIVILFVICIINVIYFENIISLGSDEANTTDIVTFQYILEEIQKVIAILEHVDKNQTSAHDSWELFEKSIDNEETMNVINYFNKMKKNIANEYELILMSGRFAVKFWYDKLYEAGFFTYTMDMLETIQPIFLAWMTNNFQREVAVLTSNIDIYNDICDEYHSRKKPYYYIIEDLMITDMKAIVPSIFINQFYMLEQDKLNPFRNRIPITEFLDLFTYGRKNHLERIKVYAEATLNIGKNVTGLFSRCEQSLLPNEHKKLFATYRMMYSGDWFKIESEKSALKNMFQRFNKKVDERKKAEDEAAAKALALKKEKLKSKDIQNQYFIGLQDREGSYYPGFSGVG